MKKFLLICMALLCVSSLSPAKEPDSKVYKARVTYYSTDPKWGNRVACQKVKYAKEGVSAAAPPMFKFGTSLEIPALKGIIGDGKFKVQDRGPAVTRKTASHGKTIVFDIYVSSRSKIRKMKTAVPDYLEVIVKNE